MRKANAFLINKRTRQMNDRSKTRIAQYRKAVLDRAIADPEYFFKLCTVFPSYDRIMATSLGSGNKEVNYSNLLRKFHMVESMQISRGVGVNTALSRKELKQRCKIGDRMAYDALDILSELELKDKQTVIPGVWLISAKKIQKAISLIHELRTEYKVKAPVDSKLDTLVTESVGDVLLSFFDDDYHPGMIGFDFTYNKDVVNLASIRELLPNPIVTITPPGIKLKGKFDDLGGNKPLNLPPSPLMLVEQVIDAFPRMYYYQDESDDCRKTYSMSGEVAAEFMYTLKSYFIHYGYIASVSLFDEIEKMSPSDTLTLQPRLATDSALSIMTFRGNINTLSNPVMHTVAIAGETFTPPIVPLMQWLNFIGTAKCKKLNCVTWDITGLSLNAIHASLHDLNRANDYFLELEHNLSIATRENESLIWTVEVHKYNATTVNFIFRSGEFNATAVLTAGSVKGTAKTEYQPLVDKIPAKPQPTKVAEDIIEPKTDTSWDLDVSPKSMFLDAVALFPEFKPCNAVPHVFKVEYNEELMNHFIDTLSRVCNLRNWVVDDIRHHHPISGNATVTTTVLRNGTLMIVFANVSGLIRVLILTDKTDK